MGQQRGNESVATEAGPKGTRSSIGAALHCAGPGCPACEDASGPTKPSRWRSSAASPSSPPSVGRATPWSPTCARPSSAASRPMRTKAGRTAFRLTDAPWRTRSCHDDDEALHRNPPADRNGSAPLTRETGDPSDQYTACETDLDRAGQVAAWPVGHSDRRTCRIGGQGVRRRHPLHRGSRRRTEACRAVPARRDDRLGREDEGRKTRGERAGTTPRLRHITSRDEARERHRYGDAFLTGFCEDAPAS